MAIYFLKHSYEFFVSSSRSFSLCSFLFCSVLFCLSFCLYGPADCVCCVRIKSEGLWAGHALMGGRQLTACRAWQSFALGPCSNPFPRASTVLRLINLRWLNWLASNSIISTSQSLLTVLSESTQSLLSVLLVLVSVRLCLFVSGSIPFLDLDKQSECWR